MSCMSVLIARCVVFLTRSPYPVATTANAGELRRLRCFFYIESSYVLIPYRSVRILHLPGLRSLPSHLCFFSFQPRCDLKTAQCPFPAYRLTECVLHQRFIISRSLTPTFHLTEPLIRNLHIFTPTGSQTQQKYSECDKKENLADYRNPLPCCL